MMRFGPISATATHLCIDMQRVFHDKGSPWAAAWMPKVLPKVVALVAFRPSRTIFTRFLTPPRQSDVCGAWRLYYERWNEMTQEHLGTDALRLVPELECFCPPAQICDKRVYGPWMMTALHATLTEAGCDTVIISGAETDMCVLAAVLGAVDLGYRVIIATDAICSSADETHDAMLKIYSDRFSMQVELAETEEIMSAWRAA